MNLPGPLPQPGLWSLLLVLHSAGCGSAPSPPASPAASPPAATPPEEGAQTLAAAPDSGKAPTAPPNAVASGAPAPHPPEASGRDEPPLLTPPGSDREVFPSGLVVSQSFLGGPPPGPPLPVSGRVLHIGDSFGGALGIELNRVLKSRGLSSRVAFETSTYIPTWAHDPKLSDLLLTTKPNLVLISLGANELDNPEPEKRIPTLRRLVERIAPRPCIWVAPVLWKGANAALLEVIRQNIGPCVYLDSNAMVLEMPRSRDGIHPSMAARPDWAEAVARWLSYHLAEGEGGSWTIRP